MQGLGNTLMEAGQYPAADKLFRELLEIQQRIFGPDNPQTAITLYNLGCVTAHRGQRVQAISFLAEAVDGGLPGYGDLGIEKDPDFNALHGDPRFTSLVAHAKQVAADKKKAAAPSSSSASSARAN